MSNIWNVRTSNEFRIIPPLRLYSIKSNAIRIFLSSSAIILNNENKTTDSGPLTDNLPVIVGLHQQVEGQSAVWQRVWQLAVFQKISVLHVRDRRDALVGLQVLKEAHCLWITILWLLVCKIHFGDQEVILFFKVRRLFTWLTEKVVTFSSAASMIFSTTSILS